MAIPLTFNKLWTRKLNPVPMAELTPVVASKCVQPSIFCKETVQDKKHMVSTSLITCPLNFN